MRNPRRWIAPAAALALLLVGWLLSGGGPIHTLKALFVGSALPELSADAGLLQIALFGFLASFHCIGMCSGSVLSLAVGSQAWKRELLFQLGRILGYTVSGAVLGGVGQVISLNAHLRALVPLLCALIMAIMALQMLGFFRWLRLGSGGGAAARLQRWGTGGAFLLGVLTALLPCGMLQIVQLAALGSGSVLSGLLTMLMFGLSTAPVLLAFGLLAGRINAVGRRAVTALSALLVLWMAVRMALRGLQMMGVIL